MAVAHAPLSPPLFPDANQEFLSMRIALNSPQAIVALLVRRRWWIIAPFLALTGTVVVLTNNLPRTFVSSTLILVQPRDIPSNFVVDLIAGTVDERLNSIKQTVLSRT